MCCVCFYPTSHSVACIHSPYCTAVQPPTAYQFIPLSREATLVHLPGLIPVEQLPFGCWDFCGLLFCLLSIVHSESVDYNINITTNFRTAKLAHITHPLTSTWQSGIVFINFVLEQNHLKYEICLHGNSLTDHDSHRISRFNYPHLYPQWLLISNPVGQLYNLIWAGVTIMHLPAKAIKFWRELAQQLYHTCSLTAKWD